MVSTVVAVLALTAACLVSSSSAQAQGATIKCYKCGSGDYGCGSTITAYGSVANTYSAWNASAAAQVTCTGQCTKAVSFTAASGLNGGTQDAIYRGCTTTTPAVGCYSSEMTGETVCVSVCSTDLCNSAVSLTQSLVVSTVGLLVAVLSFRRN